MSAVRTGEPVLGARPKGLEIKRKVQDANLNPDFLVCVPHSGTELGTHSSLKSVPCFLRFASNSTVRIFVSYIWQPWTV